MSNYTPGPWKFESTRLLSMSVDDRNGYPVCVLDVAGRMSLNAEADSRLIAAAPDLLEALKAIVAAEDAALAEWPKLSAHPWTGDEPAMKRLAAARAAIAKATGAA